MKSVPFTREISLSSLYQAVDALSMDLLRWILVFDHVKSITVTTALQHPYMAGLFDPIQNPGGHHRNWNREEAIIYGESLEECKTFGLETKVVWGDDL
ncbi:unnamed protein product [Lactuca saligna]|uniref:Mitogen-activated protein kinase n=1 Tax=Lactuca saligna TaxID=75948 RepID=A0AA36EFT2_LACSI|nr:unnamed protein product [Lactuca saligna]